MSERSVRNDLGAGVFISLAVHAAIFVLGGSALARPVEYAVQAGSGGLEINLEAGPAEFSLPEPDMEVTEENLGQKMAAKAEDELPAKVSTGQGKDERTFYSSGGALLENQPDYLRNPAPAYPWEARRKGWQGLVLLRARVDLKGNPRQVEVEQSSGHDILDQAALKAVKVWRFQPARSGPLRVESVVRIPVRFQLDQR